MKFIKSIYFNVKKYSFLLQQLVSRDFKVKYKRSALGILWSVLYPVLMMLVMGFVFSNFFKASMPDVSYLAYLLIGLVLFNYFSDATNQSMSSIVSNFSLINKMYIPKYIFPLSKCLFATLNFLITLIPLYLIIFITGTGINFYHFLLPYDILCLFMFSLGVSFLLSAICVFLRDMYYIYGIIILMWTYLTPIMYNFAIIPERLQTIFKINPMYQFINFAREIILYGRMPSGLSFIACFVAGVAMLIFGAFVFKKAQDKFIYYI